MTSVAPPSAPLQDGEIFSLCDWDQKLEEQREEVAGNINDAEIRLLKLKNKPSNDRETTRLKYDLESQRDDLRRLLDERTTAELGQAEACYTGASLQDLVDEWKALETKKNELDAERKVIWRAASAGTDTDNINAREAWPINTVQARIKLLNDHRDFSKIILGLQNAQDQIGHQIATSTGGTYGTKVDRFCLQHARATQAKFWEHDLRATLQDSIAPFANRKSIMDQLEAKRAANRPWIDTLADRCGVSLLGTASSPTGVSIQASPDNANTTLATSLPLTTFGTAPASDPSCSRTSTVQSQDGQSRSQTDRSAAVHDLASRIVTAIENNQTNSGFYVPNPRLKDEVASMIAGLPNPPPSSATTTNCATAANFSDASAYNPLSMYTRDATGPSFISVG